MSRRVVVEVRDDLHRELRKLAADYDTHLYVVVDLLLKDCLSNQERVKAVMEQLPPKQC